MELLVNFEVNLLVTLLVFALFSFSLTPLIIKIAQKHKILDFPKQMHKSHHHPTPYLGGFSIIIPILVATILSPVVYPESRQIFFQALSLICVPIFLSLVGLLDDLKNLGPFRKLAFQFVATLMTIAIFIQQDLTIVIFPNSFMNVLATLLWFIFIVNAMNFFDNLDGAAVGFVIVVSFTTLVLSYANNQKFFTVFCAALMGCSTGFLYWNKSEARIYLGDSGSLFLGLLLATLIVQLKPTGNLQQTSILVPLMMISTLAVDTFVALQSRIFARRSPFYGAQDHLSHRLLLLGYSKKKTLKVLMTMTLYFNILAVVSHFIDSNLIPGVLAIWLSSIALVTRFFLRIKISY